MLSLKAHMIAQLQRELLKLTGIKPAGHDSNLPSGLGFLREHLPQGSFPLGAVHEFVCNEKESAAATGGFLFLLY